MTIVNSRQLTRHLPFVLGAVAIVAVGAITPGCGGGATGTSGTTTTTTTTVTSAKTMPPPVSGTEKGVEPSNLHPLPKPTP